jgi:hypothetical protein
MARRIDHRTRSRWDAKTVYSTLVDQAYLTERLRVLGGKSGQLTEHQVQPGGAATIKMRHGVAAENLPAAVRTLLGGDLMIDRTETWQPDGSGGYTGRVSVTIPSMPGELGGTQHLTDSGDGSELVLDGSVSIPIPFVGGRIEETVAEQIKQLLDSEHRFTEEWLDKHQA